MPTSNMIGIKGTGTYFPKEKLEVKDLATKYHLNYNSLLSDHGVKQIHVAGPGESELFMATKAVEEALKDAKLKPKDVNVIIFCKGITRQKTTRTFSSRIIENLKIEEAYGFDIDGGLIGGLIGIQIANDVIKNNYHVNNAIVVASQDFDELYLFGGGASRIKNMIFGDGAAAIVLSNDAENNKILSSNFVVDHYTNFIDEIMLKSFHEDSKVQRVLQKFKPTAIVKTLQHQKIISKMTERWVENSYRVVEDCMKSINLDITDINHFIKTQLSLKETQLLCQKLKIDPSKIYNASSEKGHLGHADILYNLHTTLKKTNLKNLDIIALVTANYDCSSGALVLRR
ncbi:MAG TPA: 3-oxoacyl-[acyl-carrier-protein] synthase III C-terminal domain-containing protein [Candidatus Nanoarchaeia archaeon]|nr:3-oxoacyl-[acyl-carrier-protein] synthase III C-terminal domain-containing protein [Candidatus Nanoarchaeia archaeon]